MEDKLMDKYGTYPSHANLDYMFWTTSMWEYQVDIHVDNMHAKARIVQKDNYIANIKVKGLDNDRHNRKDNAIMQKLKHEKHIGKNVPNLKS
jgi:hypothetical protein